MLWTVLYSMLLLAASIGWAWQGVAALFGYVPHRFVTSVAFAVTAIYMFVRSAEVLQGAL